MRHMRHSSTTGPATAAAAAEPFVWPLKKEAVVDGDLLLGGLMMVHSREDTQFTCGPIMAQGGIQTVETMLYTLDQINKQWTKFKVGALILDDCDKDTYGLEMAIDFIKGKSSSRNHAQIGTTVELPRFSELIGNAPSSDIGN